MIATTAASSVTLCGHKLDSPAHICAFFDSRQEEYDVLSPYYKEGIEGGEDVVTIVDANRVRDHCAQIGARGVAVEDAIAAGTFRVLTAEDTYTAGGRFDPHLMYDLLQGTMAAAKMRGGRVRVSGEMDWAARSPPGCDELIAFEAKVNVLVPIYECTLVCIYDLSLLAGSDVMDIITTHPYVAHQNRIVENPNYVAPLELLLR